MLLSMRAREDRGVIATAAASLVLTAAMVGSFVAGSDSGEVSRDAYRSSLTAKLHHDGRLAVPQNATADEEDFFLTCLANGTYSQLTAEALHIVVDSDNIKTMHDADLGKLVNRAEICRIEVVAAREAGSSGGNGN